MGKGEVREGFRGLENKETWAARGRRVGGKRGRPTPRSVSWGRRALRARASRGVVGRVLRLAGASAAPRPLRLFSAVPVPEFVMGSRLVVTGGWLARSAVESRPSVGR